MHLVVLALACALLLTLCNVYCKYCGSYDKLATSFLICIVLNPCEKKVYLILLNAHLQCDFKI